MKKTIKAALVIALAALAAVSCNKKEIETIESGKMVKMSFIANNALASEDETRTELQADNSVNWLESDQLKVFESYGETTNTAVASIDALEDDYALFSATFAEVTGEDIEFTYNAVYPTSSCVEGDNKDVAKLKIVTPTIQNPTKTSFDAAADLLIAKPITKLSQYNGGDDEFCFKRVIAVGQMTLKGLSVSEPITSVKFSATGKDLTGRSYVNLSEGAVSDYGYKGQSYDYVECKYDASLNFGNDVVIFTCFPATIAAGDSFTIVAETATKRFTRTIILSGAQQLAFNAGKISQFSVDMAGVEPEIKIDYSGTYAIVAEKDSKYYALSSEVSSTRLAKVDLNDFVPSIPYATEDTNIIWNVQKQEDGTYYILNGENYLNYASKGASTSSSAEKFQIVINAEGYYTIESVENTGWGLRLNANNINTAYFAFYNSAASSTMIGGFRLATIGEDTRAILPTPTNVVATLDAENANQINVTWDAVEGAGSYTVSISPADANAQTIIGATSCSFTSLRYETTYAVSIIANPEDPTLHKDSVAATSEPVTTGENSGGESAPVTVSMTTFTSTSSNLDPVISYTASKGDGTTNPAINSEVIRIYQAASGKTFGGNIEITAQSGYKIQSITIGSAMATQIKYAIDGGSHTPDTAASLKANGTYTVSDIEASSVIFYCYGTSSSSRLYVNSLSVTYIAE